MLCRGALLLSYQLLGWGFVIRHLPKAIDFISLDYHDFSCLFFLSFSLDVTISQIYIWSRGFQILNILKTLFRSICPDCQLTRMNAVTLFEVFNDTNLRSVEFSSMNVFFFLFFLLFPDHFSGKENIYIFLRFYNGFECFFRSRYWIQIQKMNSRNNRKSRRMNESQRPWILRIASLGVRAIPSAKEFSGLHVFYGVQHPSTQKCSELHI